MDNKRRGRAWYHWYAADDSPEERRLITKLDLLIVPYAVVAYWIKYIDQSNLTNAYVSGLKEDLNFNSNQLVDLNAMYIAGAVIGQIPFTFLFPMFPMNYTIPALEAGWCLFTLLQYRTQSFAELMSYRFLVGLFEAAFFPGVHYVLGAWYRGDEIARRGGVFYVGQMLGTLTAGLIQSGASANLDGLRGMAGWRWMFIISALMTIPVAIAGVFVWPGTPAKPNMLFLSDEELSLAVKRLKETKADTDDSSDQTTRQLLSHILKDWKIYVLTFWDILFWNAGSTSYGGYLLWLKSLKRYSTPEVNQLGTTAPALGILYVLVVNFSSDLLWGPSGAIAFAHIWNFTSMTILAIWDVPEGAKWFAFNTTYTQVAMSSVLYGWANNILRHNTRERSVILCFMNLFAQSTTAWTGILVFPTVEGPRFLKGWTFCAVNSFVLVIFTYAVVRPMARREERKMAPSPEILEENFESDDRIPAK
ncbi:retrograde regulation protein 2-1 [Coleophoma cylindrospora]|uniref:Retrograde regulation protein 2-1 n=1 Tax=Coleophoma cylindrospora TaxID=1849047 RepID=A0A3D8QSN9_9HELO|nr:retrograde regulation protein 2-1 [Coleophoma cylindrospora]